MNDTSLAVARIAEVVRTVAQPYDVDAIYLFGSYARGEADENSDLDFLVYGGHSLYLPLIFSLTEDLYVAFKKNIDLFEISELDPESDFYKSVMEDRIRLL